MNLHVIFIIQLEHNVIRKTKKKNDNYKLQKKYVLVPIIYNI